MSNDRRTTYRPMQEDETSQLTFYRFVLSNLPCAVLTVDSDLRISSFNPWAETLTGYSRKEAIGRYCGEILRGGMCAKSCPLRGAMEGAEPVVRIDTTIRNRHGETLPVQMNTAALLDDDRQLIGGVEAFQDISHLKALERERANLVSMIGHDIKTPIITIGGFARRLLRQDKALSREKEKEYIDIISREAGRAESLVHEFLEFSRLEVGELRLSVGSTSLGEELADLFKTYEAKASKRGIDVEITGFETLPTIEVDGNLLRRLFINLLDNALKFSEEKGRITVAAEERENTVRIQVKDQGVGIDAKDVPYIFDPFNRSQGKKKRAGFGLGLAIVKAIVKAHGGRIHVKSELGRGSVFSVVLPKKQPRRKVGCGR